MLRYLFIFLFSIPVFGQNFQQYVNPFIGTGGHGHTFPGATVPFGMVQLSPDTRIDGSWDGCSGYHYSDSVIYGFSHTHLNGTGVSDYGDILLMPSMGNPSVDNKEYSSTFSHKNEKATAGFYEVLLDKFNIKARLTATTRVGYHEYTFNNEGQGNIILDLNHRDQLLEGEIRIINDKTIEVFRRSRAWAENQYIFARIEFSKPMKITKETSQPAMVNLPENSNPIKNYKGNTLALAFSSEVKSGEKILVKVALSHTGFDGARKNMLAEATTENFDEIKTKAEQLWNKELSKIEIKSPNKDQLQIFYTALYHAFTQPNIANDIDGKYRGRDNQIRTANHDYYTVFSLWDTFRAYHPLMTLIDKKRTADFINTFIKQYEDGKRLPIWELASNETFCMIGYHSVSVIADAMAKNIKGFDYEKAFIAAKNSANLFDDFGMKDYRKNGFLSIDDEHESVSKTLEYAYDDWCIAQMAKILGKKEDYQIFMKRAQSWKNLYNPENGFMQPRKNGGWFSPFEPREVNNHYTEGNSWQYSFFVPHDVEGLIAKHGGKQNFEKFLDGIFSAPSKTTGREQVDITGLIGQYAHGNEPSHHIAYLYNHVDKTEKVKEKVHFILNEFYKNSADGLIGNEDCGQMSAWYILSAMGIYNIAPGQISWSTTTPFFDEIKVNFEDGTSRTITKNSTQKELVNFGFENIVPTKNNFAFQTISEVPVISADRIFDQKTKVSIHSLDPGAKIYYTIQDKNTLISSKFSLYKKEFEILKTSTVLAYSVKNGIKSEIGSATFNRRPNNWKIEISSQYNPQYHAGGKQGIIDGILGTENWRKGDWQGYQGQDFVAVIDLNSPTRIQEISARFLQDSRAWILMPRKMDVYVSGNNKDFFLLGSLENTIPAQNEKVQIQEMKLNILPTDARFVKIVAQNFGKLPNWHQGFGGDSYIFIDEITIK